jgi:hypothetical protein
MGSSSFSTTPSVTPSASRSFGAPAEIGAAAPKAPQNGASLGTLGYVAAGVVVVAVAAGYAYRRSRAGSGGRSTPFKKGKFGEAVGFVPVMGSFGGPETGGLGTNLPVAINAAQGHFPASASPVGGAASPASRTARLGRMAGASGGRSASSAV